MPDEFDEALRRARGDHESLSSLLSLSSHALYGVLGEIVMAIRPHTEACDAALLVSLAVATGNAIGAGPHFVVESDRHTVALNATLVGPSGRGRKGTAGGRAMAVMRVADPGWARAAPWSGFGSGEGFVAELADPDRGDHRLLVEERELARLITVASREGSTLSANIRNAFDGEPLRRRVSKERIEVRDYHVSAIGHITIEELRRKLDATEVADGFANRFLWVMAYRARLLPEGGPGFGPDETAYWGEQLGKRIHAARSIGLLTRTAAARERWAELYRLISESELPGLAGAATNRAEAYLLRLSMLFALLDGSNRIDVAHIDAAWALVRYSEDTALAVWGDATGDPDVDRLVLFTCRAGPEGLDATELSRVLGRHKAVLPIVERARRYGLVAVEQVSTEGRPRTIVRCVPSAK